MVSNAKKNALSSYLNTAVTALVGLIVNPLLLTALGSTNFGTWKAIQRLLNVGSAANGGAMQSLKWVIAHRSKNTSDDEKRRDVGAAFVVLLYWVPVLFAVIAIIVYLLPNLLRDIPHDDMWMIYATGGILGVNVILVSFSALPDAVLFGMNQGFRSMNVTTGVLILTNAGMVVAAVLGWGLVGVAIATALGTCLNGALTFLVLRKRVGWWGLAKPSRNDIRRLSKFSGWVFTWAFVMRLSLATEVIVLSAFAGVDYVSSYTFTSYVTVLALSVCQLTTSALMPKLGSMIGNEEWPGARAIAREARELTLALATGIGSLAIMLNQSFVEIWAGGDQFMGQAVNILMTIAFVQFAVFRTDSQIQDTGLNIGKKVMLGAAVTVSTIAAAGGAFSLSDSVEIMFIALIATRLVATLGFPLLANHAIRGRSWPVGRAAVGALLLALSVGVARFVDAENLAELLVWGLMSAIVLVPTILFMMLSPSTRRKLLMR